MEKEGEYVVTRVINYGRIIPKQELDHIFQKFYRTEQSRSRDTGGTGLGLAIVKHILMRLKGELKLVSTPGQGTIITITFPSCKEDTDR